MAQSKRLAPRKGHKSPGASLTQQHMKKEADINNIASRYMRGGPYYLGTPGAHRTPQFIDVPSASFHDAMNLVVDMEQKFQSLPSRLRGRFRNNVGNLLRWVEDPANSAEAIRLGIIPNPDDMDPFVPSPPQQVNLVDEAAKGPAAAQGTPPKGGAAPSSP